MEKNREITLGQLIFGGFSVIWNLSAAANATFDVEQENEEENVKVEEREMKIENAKTKGQ